MNEIWIKVILGMIPLDIFFAIVILGCGFYFIPRIGANIRLVKIGKIICVLMYLFGVITLHVQMYNGAVYTQENPTEICEVCNGTGRVAVERIVK